MTTTPPETAPGAPGVAALEPSWMLALRAAKKSPNTVKTYRRCLAAYFGWCASQGEAPDLARSQVQRWLLSSMDEHNLDPSSAGTYLKGLKVFAKWCLKEGETERDDVADIEAPQVTERITQMMTPERHALLVAQCDPKTFLGRRNLAVLSLMKDTGGRASEICQLTTDGLSVADGQGVVRGKGNRDRFVAFSPSTALELDRYLRKRRDHPYAALPALWLGDRGRPTFGYEAMWAMIKSLARRAGIPEAEVHAHMWRHWWANSYLDRGGSADNLKIMGGWKSWTMVEHYTKQHAAQRALVEAKRLLEEG
jgi:site-specific recombinase XerD